MSNYKDASEGEGKESATKDVFIECQKPEKYNLHHLDDGEDVNFVERDHTRQLIGRVLGRLAEYESEAKVQLISM